jgi:uncharacterized protein (TIGR04552 family)
VGRPPTVNDLELLDLDSVRMLLRGDSVVDWHRLSFADHSEVDRFLRLNEFDPESEDEMGRLEEIRLDAVDYLTRVYSMAIPDHVAEEVAARDLFLMASGNGPHQKWACVVLKAMHIIHHLNGRAALLKVAVSDEQIFREIELKVVNVVEELRASHAPIAEFEWSRKPLDSQITKLLAKRSTLASNIYDKIRFRLIVPTYADILPTLATLTRQLIPFNYVVPGESVNSLIDLHEAVTSSPRLSELAGKLPGGASATAPPVLRNEFSGPEYKIINFVADLPLRLDRIIAKGEIAPDMSHVVFALTEFQITDKDTAQRNESGACSHEAYKERQHQRVRARLLRDSDDPPVPD